MANEPSAASAEAPESTANAPATVAADAGAAKKTGFLARLVGAESTIQDLQSRLDAESAAHAQARADLTAANARIAEFEALEAQLEQQAASATAEAAKAKAEAAAAKDTAEAGLAPRVASQVAAVVETLGVPEAALPATQAEPPKQGEEFASLKGLARAAAAFNAQFAS